ncbi:MAG: ABC transporter ATP-binding protein, partial [Rhodocyclaceae bacterium]|nr:ABC transporter ATP-binding protein [Rhodocyclaceae bacterium]
MIELEGVSHSYGGAGSRQAVLREVSLSVMRGQSCAIVGRSGSGKTTLLNLIGLLDTPAGGTLRIGGQDVRQLGAAQRAVMRNRTIGFVFQNFNLLPRLTALENVALPLLYQGTPRQQAHQVAQGLLARVGLAECVQHLPADLSGGQQQRVAIARALATNPAVLLADEPTGNLDSQNADDILDLLLALNRERATTLLLITHEERLAKRMARHFHLEDGRLTEAPCAAPENEQPAQSTPAPLPQPAPARR